MKPPRNSKQTAEVGWLRRGVYRDFGAKPEVVDVYVDEYTPAGCIRVALRSTICGQRTIRTVEIDADGGSEMICA